MIEVADADSLVIDSTMSSRSITWNNLFGFERLSETAAKVNVNLLHIYLLHIYIYVMDLEKVISNFLRNF